MSTQINFFADIEDTRELHEWLLAHLSGLSLIVRDRGTACELQPVRATSHDQFLGHRKILLVPEWATKRISFSEEPNSERLIVALDDSPVIEYLPCEHDSTERRVRVGRLYWAFRGSIEREQRRQINGIFSRVRSETQPLPPDHRFRVFRHAARSANTLDFEFGIEEPNPFGAR